MKKRRKIFQRVAALLCCILLLPCFVAVPASAESDTNNFMDLTDYVDSGVIALTPSKPSVSFNLPRYSVIYYVDILFSCNGSFSSLSVTKGSQTRDITVLSLGSGMYRAYGKISGNGSSTITLNFGVTSTIYIEVLSFDCALTQADIFDEIGGLWVADSPTAGGIVYMESVNHSVKLYLPEVIHVDEYSFDGYTSDFNSQLYFPNWKKYDYIDCMLYVTNCNITSLHVQADGSYVPFEVSFLGDSDTEDFSVRVDQAFEEYVYYPSVVDSYNRVMLRIDLTELNRSSVSNLNVGITGQYSSNVASLMLRSVRGHVLINSISSDMHLFNKLKAFLNDLFRGDQEFQNEVNQSVSEFENVESEIESGIDSLETPDIQDVNIVGIIGASGADSSTLKDFFAAAFDNVVVSWLMMLSFAFMLISFLLYGSFR